jgi:arginase
VSAVTTDLIGVPFDGWGRAGAQARAASALRAAGLAEAFGGAAAVQPDPALPAPDPARAEASGLMNERALIAMAEDVHARVGASLVAGRFPLVYGADCTVLLGCVPALRDAVGRAGLVFADAHEDTTSLDASPDGEAANMEIGLLLDLAGQRAPAGLTRGLPALGRDALAMLGMRDADWRGALGVDSLADAGVFVLDDAAVAADAARSGRSAALRVAANSDAWWLHVDVDVLAQSELGSSRVPGDEDAAGGLSWDELTTALSSALAVGGCRGWSISIYDPDRDPRGDDARRIVQLVRELAPLLGRPPS